ncbi:MAG: hypothetical protein KKC03_06095 [Bacteroidetes bacterium]|nr:hypothetical protein [Bacteroidota bacterium]
MWYEVDFAKLYLNWLPTFLRQPLWAILFRALAAPLVGLHGDWLLFRSVNLYKLAHNGQVPFFEKALNDSLDPSDRRIRIIDGSRFGRLYIYTKGEQKPLHLGTAYLRPASDFADTGVDFVVLVPTKVADEQMPLLQSLIEFYKIASKRYKIETI